MRHNHQPRRRRSWTAANLPTMEGSLNGDGMMTTTVTLIEQAALMAHELARDAHELRAVAIACDPVCLRLARAERRLREASTELQDAAALINYAEAAPA